MDKRKSNDLRKVKIQKNYIAYPEGSVLFCQGDTKVICNASIEERVPPHKKDSGEGWVTAEYGMLPRSTDERMKRESVKGKRSGRTHEISRLIGRSLRAVTDLKVLGERQIVLDCDVIQADGGTRCASITGSYIALSLAIKKLLKQKLITRSPLKDSVAAISTGIRGGTPLLDLNYQEDSTAEVDMNFVITGSGKIVEIQGTAEEDPFSFKELTQMKDLALKGIKKLTLLQRKVLK